MLRKILQRFGRVPTALVAQIETPARPAAIDVTDANFAEIVLASEQLTVVDCWAEWCEPCRVMSAFVNFLAQDFAERALITALDVDENPETAAAYDIMGLPTLLFIRNGVVVDRQMGLLSSYEELRQRVEQLLVQ